MADTLISRNVTKPKMQKKTGKKTPRRPVTPGRTKGKVGRDLWMNALKKRQALSMSNVYSSAASPRRKTPTEFWMDTLRKTGIGMSTETNKSQSLSGLKKGSDQHYPYMSTSHYMRQVMGTEKGRKGDDPTARASPGTPAYKSPEEYYEEVMNLRKQIAAMNHDSATSKTKIRRLEEDNQKKEKEIEALLNPGKNSELRRTLGDRQADSGAVVHSLKQKILKLEMQLRDKESSYCKLQADLKTTKLDEMRVQMEALYAEVLRLQLARESGVGKPRSVSENTAKVKALSETVIRLSRSNEQLQAEVNALKDDLHKAMEESDSKLDVKRDFADMNRKELLVTVTSLQKKLDRSESRMDGDTMSLLSHDSSRRPQGKLELQGSVEDRLHQLDERETELLDEVERLKANLRRNREERRKGEDTPITPTPRRRQSKMSDDLAGSRPTSSRRSDELAGSRPSSGRRSSRMDDGSRPTSSRSRDGRVENFKQKHAATSIQRQWRQRKQRTDDDKVEHFRQERAAKKIQHQWLGYKRDEAESTIQSAMMGHMSRRQQMNQWNAGGSDYESSYPGSEAEDSYSLIQSSLRGHHMRQEQLRSWRNQHTDDDDDSVLSGSYGRRMSYQRPSSSSYRPPSASGRRPSSGGGSRPGTGGSRPGTGQRPSSGQRPPSSSSHRPSSASLMGKRGSTSSHTFKARYDVPSPTHPADSDDDDIMF